MTEGVRFDRVGRMGLITLDRPQALNALNRAMCAAIHAALGRFAQDDAVELVAIEGAGERAFCAGGDVVGLYHAARARSPDWQAFFAAEYAMNLAIARFPKPYVALVDGISMGGGVGLSVHGPYRVATERTLFAMPETGIGLIPDVGGTHALPRFPGRLGHWAGLTGARLRGEDALHIGYATHLVPADRLEPLKEALAHSRETVAALLDEAAMPPSRTREEALQMEKVAHGFASDDLAEIRAALADGDDWAREQASILDRMSPTSLRLTAHALAEGARSDLAAALRLEYRMVSAIRDGHDFVEGVRAQLIDKDRQPKWDPADPSEVDLEPYLAEPEGGDLTL